MKLTDRLLKIASLVTKDSKLADIGTDHGYIPLYLLENNKIDFAILADVNKGPLENAKKEAKRLNLIEKVDLRLGSGIEVLQKDEVDEIIIAGMGGMLIASLLEAKLEVVQSAKKLILQPMQAQDELRKYLLNNGYEIFNEVLVREDFRIYEIIECRYIGKNTKVDDEIYYEIGQRLIENKDNLLNDLIDKKIHSYSSIIQKLDGKSSEMIDKKIELSKEKINKLEKLKI